MPILGAHVSAAKSLSLSFERAGEIGAKATQIFISPPQQWFQTKHSDEELKKYHEAQGASGINSNFIHATYLINLGTKNPEHMQKSTDWLIYAMHTASKMGVEGVVFHTGSHKGDGFETVLDQVVESIKTILKASPGDSYLILENTAGAGGTIGRDFKEIAAIFKGVDSPRLKLCLDTQHIFAAGFDIRTSEGIEGMIGDLEKQVGLDQLIVIHCNDSKTEFNLGRDRHENIGEGLIGKEAFKVILNHPKLQHLPFILEVPGFEGTGPDAKNIKILESLVK